ncbi:hypothetical protein GFO_2520 [Christiangramia forsetii KT0803]|uniref:Uncharacterized protein n=1 Tax=Christiangramia forsetii (strain DSM 17595 / CGMCC 1.15422 / KT0803) TaxID=411154 RepID=A0M4D1_CHRFK|nr:hypothetical protein GFO_2520 [Christiangramia forsetii KT0803]
MKISANFSFIEFQLLLTKLSRNVQITYKTYTFQI